MTSRDLPSREETTPTPLQIVFFDTIPEVPSLYDPTLPEREIMFLARDTFKELETIRKPDLAKTARKVVQQFCDNHPGIIKKISIEVFSIDQSFLRRVIQVFEAFNFETPPFFFRIKPNVLVMSIQKLDASETPSFRIKKKGYCLEAYFQRQLQPTYYLTEAIARIPDFRIGNIHEISAITI